MVCAMLERGNELSVSDDWIAESPGARHFLKGFLKVFEEIQFFLSSVIGEQK